MCLCLTQTAAESPHDEFKMNKKFFYSFDCLTKTLTSRLIHLLSDNDNYVVFVRFLLLCHPEITTTGDWALKANNQLSIYLLLSSVKTKCKAELVDFKQKLIPVQNKDTMKTP